MVKIGSVSAEIIAKDTATTHFKTALPWDVVFIRVKGIVTTNSGWTRFFFNFAGRCANTLTAKGIATVLTKVEKIGTSSTDGPKIATDWKANTVGIATDWNYGGPMGASATVKDNPDGTSPRPTVGLE